MKVEFMDTFGKGKDGSFDDGWYDGYLKRSNHMKSHIRTNVPLGTT